jgi:Icc-related predicted phosphoesterase
MRVAAVSDVHCPKYLDMFKQALAKFTGADLMLFVGDMVLRSDPNNLPAVLAEVRQVYGGQILACFGNEEYDQYAEQFRSFQEIRWVNDEAVAVEVGGLKVGIVGSRGSLDRPTFWQRTRVNDIEELYRQRVETIDRLLAELQTDVKIVITHYAPTYVTLDGERESSWPEMARKSFEEVIKRRQPDVWFHGHIHQGKKTEVTIGRTLVLNVALPAKGEITTVELPRKVGLEKFF